MLDKFRRTGPASPGLGILFCWAAAASSVRSLQSLLGAPGPQGLCRECSKACASLLCLRPTLPSSTALLSPRSVPPPSHARAPKGLSPTTLSGARGQAAAARWVRSLAPCTELAATTDSGIQQPPCQQCHSGQVIWSPEPSALSIAQGEDHLPIGYEVAGPLTRTVAFKILSSSPWRQSST